MRGMQLTVAATLLLVGLGATGVSAAGSIKGSVILGGPAPAPKKLEVTIDQYVCGTEKDSGDLLLSPRKELKNAVVWLENPPAGAAAPAPAAKVAAPTIVVRRVVLIMRVSPEMKSSSPVPKDWHEAAPLSKPGIARSQQDRARCPAPGPRAAARDRPRG